MFKKAVVVELYFMSMIISSASIFTNALPRELFRISTLAELGLAVTYRMATRFSIGKAYTMADVNVNAPAEQAPAMAPPTRTDDQILSSSRWVLVEGTHTSVFYVSRGKRTSAYERPESCVQILWGVINRAHIDYAERMWEEFTQSIHSLSMTKTESGTTYQGKKKSNPLKLKRVKDYSYHKEKMMMCKQAEHGVPLQAEQADWLADTDEEINEQDLETHYSFMAKIQEVLPEESRLVPSCFAIFTFEPLTLCLMSMPSCDLECLTNILILCIILKASNQSLRKSLSLNLKLS
ncbi:hypothetical protein Tco_0537900 [Tanacetum coccineum]